MAQHGFSEYGYYVRAMQHTGTGVPLLFNANRPTSAGQCADTFNDLNHLADESGQVWCDFAFESGKAISVDTNPPTSGPVHMHRVGPFPIRTRPASTTITTTASPIDGGGFSLRVRLGGSCVNNNGTAAFIVIVTPGSDAVIGGQSWSLAQTIYNGGPFTGTVPAWATKVTGVSQVPGTPPVWSGSVLATDILTVSASQLFAAGRSMPTLDPAGNPTNAAGAWIAVDVFGFATGASNGPLLNALYVAEYVG